MFAHNPPFFAVEVHSAGYIPHQLLFDVHIDESLKAGGFGGSHIYYLVRTPKLRFIPSSASISNLLDLTVDILVADTKSIKTRISLTSISPFSKISLKQLKKLEPTIDMQRTTPLELGVNIDIDGEIIESSMPLIAYVASQDINFGFKPEILYIGQSFDMLNRWRNHKKVNQVTSILKDVEELRLYFIQFKFFATFNEFGDIRWNTLLDMSDRTTKSFRDRISVLEQSLIQFYRPILNEQLVGGHTGTAPYQRIIQTTGIKGVGMSLGMYGHAFQFWSPQQRLQLEVVTLIDNNGVPHFKDGLNFSEFLGS